MTALTIFDAPKLQVPAHLAELFGEEGNIAERQTVPALSYDGKVWTISANGEKTKLTRVNADGDEEPVSVLRVVVLAYAKRRGRAYYPGTFDPAKPGTPLCFTEDGEAPHASAQEKQSTRCEGCPMAIKGSRQTENGKLVSACSQHRMLAVVPANKLDFSPLRLKLAITSDWDKQNPEADAQNWFAFQNYVDWLRGKGVNHTAKLVTKMRFDPNAHYPKVLFSPDRWLTHEEGARVVPTARSPEVQTLLGGTWSPAGADGTRFLADGGAAERREADAAAKAAAAERRAAEQAVLEAKQVAAREYLAQRAAKEAAQAEKAKAASTVWDEDEDEQAPPPPPPPPPAAEKRRRAAPKPAAAAAPAVEHDEDGVIAEPRAAAPKPAAAAVGGSVPQDVADLLTDWGEE